MELLIGLIIGYVIIRLLLSHNAANLAQGSSQRCNERRLPHKWEWIEDEFNPRLKCRECGYTFGEE
jgi:uncharacterized membrane-anchored protein YhcB (DUF1043 family)